MKRGMLGLVLMLALMLGMVGEGFAQSAKDAMLALQKLHARTEAGLNNAQYSQALGEAKFPVNLFLDGPEAKKNPEFTLLIKGAIKDYDNAGYYWDIKVNPTFQRGIISGGEWLNPQNEFSIQFLRDYPMANKSYNDGGAINTPSTIYEGYLVLSYMTVIPWKEAFKKIKEASTLLDSLETTGNVQKDDIEKLKSENARLKKENADLKAKLSKLLKQKTN